MHAFNNTATQAARVAGKVIVRALDNLDKVKVNEKSKNDFVTDLDKTSEKLIIETIQKAYPDHGFLAEECGQIPPKSDDLPIWIIDPIDGTRNFLQGFPHFAISIAVEIKGEIEHGIVYDPFKDELFSASKGRGAQLNGRRLRASQVEDFEYALIGVGFAVRKIKEKADEFKAQFNNVVSHCSDFRRAGACALDLAYIAAGRLDGFWEGGGLGIWDIAAGALLVKEAGGYISVNTSGNTQDANAIPIPKDNADMAFDAATCIGCGACVASCKNSSAMLFVSAKVSQFALLPQGQVEAKDRVTNMVNKMDEEGFGNCTNTGACEVQCPKGISLDNISRMNREFLSANLKKS